MNRKSLAVVAPLMMIATLGIAGCGTNSSPTTNTTSHATKSTAKPVSKTKSRAKSVTTSAIATLNSTKGSKVKGTATLTLNAKTHQLTVTVKATGLAPGSVHPELIRSGTTTKSGQVVYKLKNLTANKHGDADATTVVKSVKSIPASGWVINVNQASNQSHVLVM
ncbi:CHRD domain-containing protein [Alicyclobacillus kakegawensis]|uniref:CHRD domain-containing protein n=1 Tax=Alicyclobacillus kakegawensis TaxID=392012 RepID=UPI0012ED37FF|nr:CHRD domain-containing protein [Alicyclobacillus kakegawensis]